jgi:ADP-ribose pyrophosphatase YjhB (NUDIX family)
MAIAQNGLTFAEDPFDRQRYEQIRDIAAEIGGEHTDMDVEQVRDLFAQDAGYATPKIDVRAAIFEDGQILLVRERSDGLWTLPGGWADVGESPSVAVVREVREEAGYECRVVKLLAIYDRDHPRHGHPFFLFHSYKVIFRCELVGGEASHSIETSGVGFFSQDDLPDLSLLRVTPSQIARLFEHRANPGLPADFD